MEHGMNLETARMKLNHLSFPSNDVAATAAFFEQQLGCSVTPMGTSCVLKRPGFDIVIEDARDYRVEWPRNFHLGLELPSLDEVRGAYARFKANGVEMAGEVFYHERGSRFFCVAPGGLLFEINTRADASEAYRETFESQIDA
jgi:catechol 2,3-dioxygenase-like lactoylglutathione lyase family enzyme